MVSGWEAKLPSVHSFIALQAISESNEGKDQLRRFELVRAVGIRRGYATRQNVYLSQFVR